MVVLPDFNLHSIDYGVLCCLWKGKVHLGIVRVLGNDLLSDELILQGDLFEPFKEGGRVLLDHIESAQLRHVIQVGIEEVSYETYDEGKAHQDLVPALLFPLLSHGKEHFLP